MGGAADDGGKGGHGDLGHHLFDTRYHAIALETPGAVLVTADDWYARKAAHLGSLVLLADLVLARHDP